MRKSLLVLAFLFCSMSLYSQKLPEDWHRMADTAWAIDNATALVIVAGEGPNMATAKKIALARAKSLGVNLMGEEVADTLISKDGYMKITRIRIYKQATSVIREEVAFLKENQVDIVCYLAVRVTVIK